LSQHNIHDSGKIAAAVIMFISSVVQSNFIDLHEEIERNNGHEIQNHFHCGNRYIFCFWLSLHLFPEFAIMRFSNESALSIPTQFIVRWWGAALLGLGATLLFALKASPDSIAMRALYIGHFVHMILGFFITIADIIWSNPKPTIWIIIMLFGVMAILFGLLAFKKKA
jgi:hypothetical protein